MIFEQFYLGCLSQASYLVGDPVSKRAVVVDPIRDTMQYTDFAAAHGLTITMVIETHVHADFLSGHLELAAATGAEIAYGAGAAVEFPARMLTHGERIDLGSVVIEVRATPGHTPESISLVLFDSAVGPGEPWAVLTGDTLFIGDVGRPDLLSSKGVSAAELGRMLYRSTREQLLTLPDHTKVFPGHGAGSSCGKKLSNERDSTIGAQRASNYALADMTEDEFVAVVTEGQSVPPNYFPFAAQRNRQARELFRDVDSVATLTLDETLVAQRNGVAVIDMRSAADYHAGHLRGSVSVPRDGRFAELAGQVVQPGQPVIVVGSNDDALDAHIRLSRIGFDTLVGRIDPLAVSGDSVRVSERISGDEFVARLRSGADVQVVDVRNPGETAGGVVAGAVLAPLPGLLGTIGQLDPARPTVLYCASGLRSGIATGLFEAAGFTALADVIGAYDAAVSAGAAVEDPATRTGGARVPAMPEAAGGVAVLAPSLVRETTVDELQGSLGSYCAIDVREQAEFDAGHIAGATLMPLGRIDAELVQGLAAGRPILMVCRSGRRSMTAAQQLAESSIASTNLNGGTLAWVAAGWPIVSAQGNEGSIA